jgi:hypothetical protein
MHYAPSLIAVALTELGKVDTRPSRVAIDTLVAYAVFCVWLINHDPYAIYGCGEPGSDFNSAGLAVVSTLLSYALVNGIIGLAAWGRHSAAPTYQ